MRNEILKKEKEKTEPFSCANLPLDGIASAVDYYAARGLIIGIVVALSSAAAAAAAADTHLI
jgi:hypothetical protein